MERRCRTILLLLTLLVLLTAGVIIADMRTWSGQQAEDMRTFQRATGGLGMGAIATPLWQFINYDPRILSVDDSITWPVPGGYSFGPDRTGTVSYFEEVTGNQWIIRRP
jgi:hypothetical protein